MVRRIPQYSTNQRNFLFTEYVKRKGSNNFLAEIAREFAIKFPNARRPAGSTIRRLVKKQRLHGTVNNLNSIASPGKKNPKMISKTGRVNS